ncbi:MAG: hypothetical protein JSV66_13435 [Trueperaceae bacterium]|nr:MAG: hypothetical protein JSV66_13435 [Trueperaceae bacterium]
MTQSEKRLRHISRLTILLGLATLLLAPVAFSGELRSGDSVWLAPDEVLEDDLYVTATTFVLDGIVRGDVLFAGQNLTVNGTIEGDLMAGGQTITINGSVTDDVRLGGAVLLLGHGSRIGDDVSAAGYSFEAEPGSVVDGGLGFTGRQATLAGTIAEDLLISAYGLELYGTVAGNVEASLAAPGTQAGFDPNVWLPGLPAVAEVHAGLRADDGAVIGGNLNLTTNESFPIPSGLVAGEVVLEEIDSFLTTRQNPFLSAVRRYFVLAVIGLLLLWLTPQLMRNSATAIEERAAHSLGLGAVILVGVPLAIVLCAALVIALAILFGTATLGELSFVVATIGAALLVPVTILFGLAVIYLSQVLVGFLVGRWVLDRYSAERTSGPLWPLLLGLLIVLVLTAIPYFGPMFAIAVSLFGLGSLWLVWRDARRGVREPPPASPQTAVPAAS